MRVSRTHTGVVSVCLNPASAVTRTPISYNHEAKRFMRPRDLFLSAALAASAWTPSLSQSNTRWTPRFGVIGGANVATLTGSGFEKPSRRTGFAAGFMAVLPVAPSFAIQPELMFTMKGNSESGGTIKINYVELPLLARFEAPAFGRVKPFAYGGPGFAYRMSCALEGSGFSMTCDSAQVIGRRASPGVYYSRTDVDGIMGGGLVFDVAGRTMTVSVRYDVGFVRFLSDGDMKTRVLSFVGTFEWPFRK
jgi:hypothetical protein